MKIVSTTTARKNIAEMVNEVSNNQAVFVIGRRNEPEALLISYPKLFNPKVSELTNLNANSSAFDFLIDEPDIYAKTDVH